MAMSDRSRPRRPRNTVDYSEDIDVDDEPGPSRPTASARSAPAATKLYQIAAITQLATDEPEGISSAVDARSSAAKLDQVGRGILSRIEKSLRLAKHPATGEAEARQALRLATRLMASQNLTQADLITSEDAETAQSRAGMSQVEIISTTGSMVRNESWANRIAIAINLFFSVKAYSTSHVGRHKLTWTFYGLAINTVAAATAFEMVHNQVLTWAADNKAAKGKTGKHSYCQGVAAGLIDMAKKEKKEELRLAIKAEKQRLRDATRKEKAEREREIERLQGPAVQQPATAPRQAKVQEAEPEDEAVDVRPFKRSPSSGRDFSTAGSGRHQGHRQSSRPPVKAERSDHGLKRNDSSSNYDDDDDYSGAAEGGYDFPTLSSEMEVKPDFDEELEPDIIDLTNDTDDQDSKREVKITAEQLNVNRERDVDEAEQAKWRDSGQLIQFRQNAEKIADDYLKSVHGDLKLRKCQANSYIKDAQAYEQGRQDAKMIDVKRRRIGGGDG